MNLETWDDLDLAYLLAFDEHPDLDEVERPGKFAPSPAPASNKLHTDAPAVSRPSLPAQEPR